ncbi:MAG: histidinol-phosphatase HisJ [Candidatus Lokiarchaeota archaeon]|nr:histidinol-phosphatase HisJ [Candidatus Lokiarchaeota archaeon]
MRYEDWHTHNSLCKHAVGTMEEYVKRAIELNLNVIGISDHFPYEYLISEIPSLEQIPYEGYAMTLNKVDGYISRLEQLRNIYQDQIKLRFAFEVDYFKNQDHVLNRYLKNYKGKLDYIFGSVHVLFGKAGIFAFDDGRFLNKYKEYDVNDEVYLEFYTTLQDMIKSPTFDFDIVTHFDLPKKFDKRVENKKLIMDKVIETLELVKKRNLTVEINTSGLRKEVKEQYPSEEIIREMYNLDIPILLGSDAHQPKEIAYKFKEITNVLKNMGYNQLAHYERRKRLYVDI